jgi:cytochrome c biogenesis factor
MVATIKLIKNKNVEIINLSTVFSQSGPKFRTLTSADGKLEFSLERIMKGEKPILILKYKELNQQMNDNRKEALVAEISIKPAINLFWFGNILMLAGFLLSYYKRKKEIIK